MNKKDKLLAWVTRSGPILESQIVGSGMSRALNDLLIEGKVTIIPHPTVKEKGGAPAAAVMPRRPCPSGS